MGLSRRRFLKQTITAAAACGLARPAAADDTRAQSVTDTHVYLGHWPHRQFPNDIPARLATDLRKTGATQAWVGSFDGLFHKDVAGVNQRLAEACAQVGDKMLIPFGTINPTLPDWEDDIRRCHEAYHMPGVRLHPSYHGYTLDDPRFTRLLELVATRKLIVQLVAWMEREQHLLLNPQAPEVNLKPLAEKISAFPLLRLVVANGYRTAEEEEFRALVPMKSVYFDFARTENAKDVHGLIDKASAERVVFGSGMPLHDIQSAVASFQHTQTNDDNREAIATKNASRLVGANRIH